MKRFLLLSAAVAVLAVPTGCTVSGVHPMTGIHGAMDAVARPGIVKVRISPHASADGKNADFIYAVNCPNCRGTHKANVQELIAGRECFEMPGFVLTDGEVLIADPGFRPDFPNTIEAVSVSGAITPLEIAAWYPDEGAVALKTPDGSAPAGSRPLKFAAPRPGAAQFDYFYTPENGVWVNGTTGHNAGRYSGIPAAETATIDFVSPQSLVIDEDGRVNGVNINAEAMATDGGHDIIPEHWRRVSAEEAAGALLEFEEKVEKVILPVRFSYRPLDLRQEIISGNQDESIVITRQEVTGVVMPDGSMLVPVVQSMDMIARIVDISVFCGGREIPAGFDGAMADYNVVRIIPEEKLPDTVGVNSDPVEKLYGKSIFLVQAENYGDEMLLLTRPSRVTGLVSKYRNVLFPAAMNMTVNDYMFDADGRLAAITTSPRPVEPVVSGMESVKGPCAVPATVLALGKYNPAFKPRDAADRLRFDWIGVETRPVDTALARASGNSRATGNGRRGIVVAKVYPGTPAAACGLRPGDIILSIKPEKDSRVRMTMEPDKFNVPDWEGNFLWDEYDTLPESKYDTIPTPWLNQRTPLNLLLSQYGPEGVFDLSFARDGEIRNVEIKAEKAPLTFENVPRKNFPALGLTACDPTIEVRDYFRMGDDDPGVLITRVRSGSRASVAGLKPYEVITAVNGRPVKSAEEFADMIGELEKKNTEAVLTVRRLGVSRLVRIRIAG